MMRQIIPYLIAAVICIMLTITGPASGASTEKASLSQLIEENKNIKMDVDEMAFFLATHGYDAMPKGDSVVINVDGETYKIVP